jgi:hypothetical protein
MIDELLIGKDLEGDGRRLIEAPSCGFSVAKTSSRLIGVPTEINWKGFLRKLS